MKKVNLILIAFIALITFSCNQTQKSQTESDWQELFNGKDLSGWHQIGGEALYEVKEDVIVGISKAETPNSFLVSDKKYSDFILELELKVDEELNSGIQIRSNSLPDYKDGRFHGYQVEIDPDPKRARFWSGGIYDEARRGWIYPLTYNPKAIGALKNGQWNKYRIECIGNNIKTWINDVPVANLFDEMTAEGYIGLQVHSVPAEKAGKTVMWKNIRIVTENLDKYSKETTAPVVSRLVNKLTEAEKADGWKLLFDGKTTNGWRGAHKDSFPQKGWTLNDGMLVVHASGGGESEYGGDIVTVDEYSAFELRVEFKITEGANSGIKYFVTEKEAPSGSAHGVEFQILDDKKHPDAEKYTSFPGSRTLGSLYDLIKAENKRFAGVGQWNEARLVVQPNNHVEHWLNGQKVLEYERGSQEFRELVAQSKYADKKYNEHENFGEASKGHILLQDHGDEVFFRSIKIKELKHP